jgi:hypothetical protein
MAKEVKEVKEATKKVRRFSNLDIYELVVALRADVDKEMNLRRIEKRPGVVRSENEAELIGLVQGLQVVIQRYKIYANIAKHL